MIMGAKGGIDLTHKGQALVEFLIFLPFILMMYSLILSISNSINASINQQKITRSYFYFLAAGNSTLPYPGRESSDPYKSWRQFGMQIMGWSEKLDGKNPVAPCYKFNLLLGNEDGDECESAYTEPTTQFIRIMTVYGICGATYSDNDGFPVAYPRPGGELSPNSCTNQ